MNRLLELKARDGCTLILGGDPSGLWLVHEVPGVDPQPSHPVDGHLCPVQPILIGTKERPHEGTCTSSALPGGRPAR